MSQNLEYISLDWWVINIWWVAVKNLVGRGVIEVEVSTPEMLQVLIGAGET